MADLCGFMKKMDGLKRQDPRILQMQYPGVFVMGLYLQVLPIVKAERSL